MSRTRALKTRSSPGSIAKRSSCITELVGWEVTLVGGDVRSEVDADRLFKTEGKDPGKQNSSEDDLADELQLV